MDTGFFNIGISKKAQAINQPVGKGSFSFTDAKGNILSTADLKGKVVFINFWATWCPPCRAELPTLNDLYNQFRNDDRFVFLFLNEDKDTGKAAAYLQSSGFVMPVMTTFGEVPSGIYSETLPITIILDKEEKVVFKHEGLAKYNSKEFVNQLKALL